MLVHFLSLVGRERAPDARFLGGCGEGENGLNEGGREGGMILCERR